MDNYEWLIAFLALVAAAIVVGRVLSRAAQPLRRELAEKGERLRADPAVPADVKEAVEYLLNDAFGSKAFYIFAIIAMPFVALVLMFRARWLTSMHPNTRRLSPENRAIFMDMCRIDRLLTIANHPVLMPIILLEMVIFLPPAIIFRAIIKGSIPTDIGEENILGALAKKMSSKFSRPHHA
jgi:hypothetical protein